MKRCVLLLTAGWFFMLPHSARAESWWFLREQLAVAGWPGGLISDTRAERRIALHRSDSILFQDTHAGAGARFAVAPAFVELGPRVTLAPIDVFDVTFSASALYYWPSSSGLLPYDSIDESTRDKDRGDRHRTDATRAVASTAFTLQAAPTLKAQVGPIIAVDAWTFTHYMVTQPDSVTAPYVYEAYWDRLIEWNDTVVEHQAVVFAVLADGSSESGRMLWVGPTFRQRWALSSGDRSTGLGAFAVFRPSNRKWVPQLVGIVLPYLDDDDRVGGVPWLALSAVWVPDLSGVQ